MSRLTTPMGVAVALTLFLIVNGFLYYRYQGYLDQLQSRENFVVSSTASDDTTTSEPTTNDQTNEAEDPTSRESVHRATPENIVANSIYIDNPLTNNDPNAVILATQIQEPDDVVANNVHQIGVWYDRYRGGRWAIFNQDLAPMTEGTAFNVTVLEETEQVVHRAVPANTVTYSTYIDHPLTNGNSSAVLSVTQNWNPGGGTGVYNDHSISVRYEDERGQWVIFNQDLAPMPNGASFNVAVSE